MSKWKQVMKQEPVFIVAFILAMGSIPFIPVNKQYIGYIDFKVLAILFCLMVVVSGFTKIGAFESAGFHMLSLVKNTRSLARWLIFICFFLSMWITNDVALVTFIPFSIYLWEEQNQDKTLIRLLVLETLAANLGSMLTPIGNPQNLYIYSQSEMTVLGFVKIMLPLTLVAFVLLFVATFLFPKEEVIALSKEKDNSVRKNKMFYVYLILFSVCLLPVFHAIPWWGMLMIVSIIIAISDYTLFKKVDYGLLLTFLCFFIFVGNMSHMEAIREWLVSLLKGKEYLTGCLLSQVISNVPATMLLTPFTNAHKALLYGVDVGGMGTLIASMASLISYKGYAKKEDAKVGKYLVSFTLWNVFFLLIIGTVGYLLI